MLSTSQEDRGDVRQLLTLLKEPQFVAGKTLDQWDLAIRKTRMSELLGVVAHRLEAAGVLSDIPQPVLRHLVAAKNLYLHRRQVAFHVLWGLNSVFADAPYSVVLLKGTAYVAQALEMSFGRLFDDVDIMVPRERIDDAEQRLQSAGWISTMPDPYDQRYYREWSHEIPPMEHPQFGVQLDVHHTILPVTGRVRPNPVRLLSRSMAVPGQPWRVLHPADQVLHASAHLIQDSDCTGRFRELVDIDGLIRCHRRVPDFWQQLADSADEQGLGRTLWYALRYCTAWLGTAIPVETQARLDRHKPPVIVERAMDACIARVIFGRHPDARPARSIESASLLLKFRAQWLRMPLGLLAYHAAMKSLRAWQKSPSSTGADA